MPENYERIYELFPKNKFVNIEDGDIIKIGKIRMKLDRISFFKSKNKYENEIMSQNS